MVIRAKILGYCMGVRRAVDAAYKALSDFPSHKIYTLGPLIHNKTAITMLQNDGIEILNKDSISILTKNKDPSVVILSAHGTPYSIRKEIENAKAVIIDATCPRVLVNQKRIAEHANKGFHIFIVGDKTHAEVMALEGSLPKGIPCNIFQNAFEAKRFLHTFENANCSAILISQTTITQEEYDEVCNVLTASLKNIIVYDTICPATLERQTALRTLFEEVNALIVIGGKNSANTKRLYQIAVEMALSNNTTKPVCHIETADEIPSSFFQYDTIGLTAGASTPDEVIFEVETFLLKGSV